MTTEETLKKEKELRRNVVAAFRATFEKEEAPIKREELHQAIRESMEKVGVPLTMDTLKAFLYGASTYRVMDDEKGGELYICSIMDFLQTMEEKEEEKGKETF